MSFNRDELNIMVIALAYVRDQLQAVPPGDERPLAIPAGPSRSDLPLLEIVLDKALDARDKDECTCVSTRLLHQVHQDNLSGFLYSGPTRMNVAEHLGYKAITHWSEDPDDQRIPESMKDRIPRWREQLAQSQAEREASRNYCAGPREA